MTTTTFIILVLANQSTFCHTRFWVFSRDFFSSEELEIIFRLRGGGWIKLMYFDTSDPRLVCKNKKQTNNNQSMMRRLKKRWQSLIFNNLLVLLLLRQGPMASWLAYCTPHRVVWVLALAGATVLYCKARQFINLTVPLSTQGYKWIPVNAGGNAEMD